MQREVLSYPGLVSHTAGVADVPEPNDQPPPHRPGQGGSEQAAEGARPGGVPGGHATRPSGDGSWPPQDGIGAAAPGAPDGTTGPRWTRAAPPGAPWPKPGNEPPAWTRPGSGSPPGWTEPGQVASPPTPEWAGPFGSLGPPEPGERRTLPTRKPPPPPTAGRRVLATELALVLLLAFAPGLLGLLVLATSGHGQPASIDQLGPAIGAAVFSTFLAWTPVLVLGYMLVRNGEGFAAIGLGRFHRWDAGTGVALWVGSWVLVFVLSIVFSHLGSNDVDFLPKALPLWFRVANALTTAVTAGITEEVVVRGYAQTRLEQLRAPTAVILLLPTGLWALLHLYQGVGPAVIILCLGLAYAVFFQRTRRLWPLVIAHGAFDLTQLVLILLTRG
jgi:membrane protease YdiL (CAAX protease family)